MKELTINDLASPLQKTVVALGNFDGVHLGHQTLIKGAVKSARKNGDVAAVVSFWPHPLAVIAPDKAPEVLTSPRQRRDLIAQLDPHLLIWIPFAPRVATLSPNEFVTFYLHDQLGAKQVWVGDDFRFGYQRLGGVDDLIRLGDSLGFSVRQIKPVFLEGERISSSLIRSELAAGRVERASLFLGRFYSLSGKVIPGAGRGKKIGYPTANLDPEQGVLPKDGVYAGQALVRGEERLGVVNIGRRPTFGEKNRGVEIHLPGWHGSLVGSELSVFLIARIRPEIAFASPDDLARQIARDVKSARQAFEGARK